MKERKKQKSGYFIRTSFPGERVAADILETSKKERVIVMIDYFSRKVYAKMITDKQSYKILNFIKDISRELKICTLQTDNGKEFLNKKLTNFLEKNNIKHKHSIPYYHPSNGRVERVNRTIREGIKKTEGSVKTKLKEIILNYNNSYHRGVGMSPDEAMKKENREKVIPHSDKYAKEFKRYLQKNEEFQVNDKVLIKNETKQTKMENEFNLTGNIKKCLGKDSYEVLVENGNKCVRHATQLKLLERGELDVNVKTS